MDYFVINKKMDYDRGYLFNTVYEDGVLSLSEEKDYGAFISRVFDCKKEYTLWHRFTVKELNPLNTSAAYTFYASESSEIIVDGISYSIEEYLKSEEHTIDQKKEKLKRLEKKAIIKSDDFLLHEVQGRYMFFIAEFYRIGGEAPKIGDMVVYFPKEDWLRFLPGIYSKKESGADFISRFLGIFQSIYDDCDRRIHDSHYLLEPAELDYEGLKQLSSWFNVEDLYIWPEEKLRRLIQKLPELIDETGTVKGMIDFIELYTGEAPLLVECQDTSGVFRPEMYELPYGNNPYEFVLLVKDKYISTARDYKALMCLINQMKPLYMKVKLIPLRDKLVLGAYSYLGINSEIGSYNAMCLDGRSALIFSALGRDRKTGGEI